MTRLNLAAALLALGSLAALPACSPSYRQTSSAAPMPASSELSPGMVRQVQTALQQQGLYNGAIDGIWGPQTQGAVQSFQQSHALRASGQLNSATLAALNLPADNNAASSQQSSTAAPAPADATNSSTSTPSTSASSSNGSTSAPTP
jgi:N-acetylmuramoyl-L-alanine amidase